MGALVLKRVMDFGSRQGFIFGVPPHRWFCCNVAWQMKFEM
jgi:hypothetical protein